MAQYKIDFVSLKGTEYQVQIFDTTTFDSDSATALKGAPEPFTTEEDDDEAPDCWVRQCTGYIRFIDEDNATAIALCTATPYSMHVHLYDKTHSKRVFCGFLKPEQYNQPAFGYNEEIEIPIVSHLTRWYEKYMSNSIEGIKGVGQILATIMQGAYDYVLVPNNALMANTHVTISDDYARQYIFGNDVLYYLPSYNTPKATQLGFWVDNFKEAIDRVEPTEHAMWGDGPYKPCTYGDVLDSICALLGWQICEDNGMLLCRDINQQGSVTYQKINISKLGVDKDSMYESLVNDDEYNTASMDYCSDDNTYETIAPYNLISVRSEARPLDKKYIDISEKENITLNGVRRSSTSDVFFEVPEDNDALTQYHFDGGNTTPACNLLNNPDKSGGELVGWQKLGSDSKGHSVLLQEALQINMSVKVPAKTNHSGITIWSNEPVLLMPRTDSRDKYITRLKLEGKMRCNDSDGVISEGDDFSGPITINVNAAGSGMAGAMNITDGKLSVYCDYNINYDACHGSQSSTSPLYEPEVVRARIDCRTSVNYRHVMIDNMKLSHTNNEGETLYSITADYGDVGNSEVIIPQNDDNKLEITTKLGIPYTDGALTMHYINNINVTNSARATTKYARFRDFPTKVIGNNLSVEDCLQRVFDNIKTSKIRHKLTIYVRDDVRYYTRITHNSKTYLPVSRKWNWRDDECELTILSIPELS